MLDKKFYNMCLDKLNTSLSKDRLLHSLGVAHTAACLSMRYGYDSDKAFIAGLLHDCAKCMDSTELLKKMHESNIILSDEDLKSPAIWHAYYGSVCAKIEYSIDDNEILEAIKWHTTGKPNMTLLEKIIYISDYIEITRKRVENLDKIREKAFIDLTQSVYLANLESIKYLKSKNIPIHSMSLNCIKWLEGNGINDR